MKHFPILVFTSFMFCACGLNNATSVEPTPAPDSFDSMEITEEINCQAAMTQFEINYCSHLKRSEKLSKLNSLISDLQGYMDESQYASLVEIEVNWQKVAIEHCQWQADFFSTGSVRPMWLEGCLAQQYSQRVDSLRMNLCEGNGMTGECKESLSYKE